MAQPSAVVQAPEVIEWFADAGLGKPTPDVVLQLVHYINLCDSAAKQAVPLSDEAQGKMKAWGEASRALTTLRRVLPDLVEFANGEEAAAKARERNGEPTGLLLPEVYEKWAGCLRALDRAVAAAFDRGMPLRRPGKKRAPWKARAKAVAWFITGILRGLGHDPVYTATNSRYTKLLRRALAKIEGTERKLSQIVEAFRP